MMMILHSPDVDIDVPVLFSPHCFPIELAACLLFEECRLIMTTVNASLSMENLLAEATANH